LHLILLYSLDLGKAIHAPYRKTNIWFVWLRDIMYASSRSVMIVAKIEEAANEER